MINLAILLFILPRLAIAVFVLGAWYEFGFLGLALSSAFATLFLARP